MYQSKSSLEVAVEAAARVDAVLAKRGKIKPNPIATALATANKSSTDLFQTEFEINDVPITARNLLTKGITQEEINHFSGASISTRGRFVNPEDKNKLPKGERPLYLFIQGPNKQSLDLAIQRIDSLIKEVMEQEKFKIGPPPPILTMQTSLPGMEKVIIGLDNVPPTFDVRNKVLGPGGANLQYISNETGAVVTLRGRTSGYPEAGTGQESPEPLHICVEHQKIEVLQAARQLAFNLVETIQQEFAQLHPQMQQPPLQLPPQPGQVQTVALQPEQLPPGMVATSIQVPVLPQQPGQVGQLVNIPPPSLGVPPPQLMQQPPPMQPVNLPPPGIHIPAHQGPLVPQQQAVVQQQILQQAPPNVAHTGLPPPGQQNHPPQVISEAGPILSQPPPTISTQAQPGSGAPPTSVVTSIPQQTQAFITHTTYPVQYIQANGQTLMAYHPQVKPDGQNQVQLIQTQQGQVLQAQPGTVIPAQQQAQLQLIPGPGGTQQLVMQQPQQVTMLLQYQQQNEPGKGGRILANHQRLGTPVQIQLPGVQLINPQLLQSGQTQFQLQLQQPISQQLIPQAVRALTPQPNRPMLQAEQQQIQQQIQLQQQQLQQQAAEQHPQPQQLQQPQHMHQMPPQQIIQQQVHPQSQQIPQNQIQNQQIQQAPPVQQQMPQGPQQAHQNPQVHQNPQHMQQQQPPQLQQQQPAQQAPQQPQAQQVSQTVPQTAQQVPQNKDIAAQQNKQSQQPPKQNLSPQNQQQPTSTNRMAPSQPQQQQGQKRRYEDDQQSPNIYQGPPQPVPPPKMPPPQKHQLPARGIGNGANMAQKPTAAQMSQLPPQIQKQLMPPPPPPQQGAPDEWRNSQPDQMNQVNRVEQPPPQGENRVNITRQERPTFNHYSSKPQLYNASMPFHMQGLGAYPPPPPPPPPGPSRSIVPGQYPFYQQQPANNQYPYFMMHHQQ